MVGGIDLAKCVHHLQILETTTTTHDCSMLLTLSKFMGQNAKCRFPSLPAIWISPPASCQAICSFRDLPMAILMNKQLKFLNSLLIAHLFQVVMVGAYRKDLKIFLLHPGLLFDTVLLLSFKTWSAHLPSKSSYII